MTSRMLRPTPRRSSALLVALLALGACSIFRDAPPPNPADVRAEQVQPGLPSAVSVVPPLPAGRDTARTYTFSGRNDTFFSTSGTPEEVRDELQGALARGGYSVRRIDEQVGGYSISFARGSKVGTVIILREAPERFRASFDLPGTFVEVLYDLTPPPMPALPGSTRPATSVPRTTAPSPSVP